MFVRTAFLFKGMEPGSRGGGGVFMFVVKCASVCEEIGHSLEKVLATGNNLFTY